MTTSPIDLRLGRWQDVLADVTTCDALICDPPYSARTHEWQRTGSSLRVPTISYDAITADGCREIADSWAPRTSRWAVVCCDHRAFSWHEAAWEAHGWLVFAPLLVKRNPPPRFSGDGPTLALEFLCMARRRGLDDLPGSLPGWYEMDVGGDRRRNDNIAGQKNVDTVAAIVRDYSRPGDLVVDPFCGSGTTALACAMEGRRCITSEEKPEHYEIARKRLARGYTPNMFT